MNQDPTNAESTRRDARSSSLQRMVRRFCDSVLDALLGKKGVWSLVSYPVDSDGKQTQGPRIEAIYDAKKEWRNAILDGACEEIDHSSGTLMRFGIIRVRVPRAVFRELRTMYPSRLRKSFSDVPRDLWHTIPDGVLEAPNDPKLSDSGPEAGAVSTAARGEGAGCAGASWRAAQPVTEPVGPQPVPGN